MLDEPTWKKRGCGTSVLTGLMVLTGVAATGLMLLAGFGINL